MIIFTGGKTAGHIYPLLELIKLQDRNNVLYIGLCDSLEEKLCKDNGINFLGFPMHNTKELYFAYKKIKQLDFDLVVSTGGFVSFPALLASKVKKKKYILLEENIIFGLTNKLFKGKAYKVCLAFPMKKMKHNYVQTFNPVVNRKIDYLKYPHHKYRILILGGSLGSKVMCEIADELATIKKANEEIIVVSKNHAPTRRGILYYPYVVDLPSLIASSDFIISRAGGGSICEILGLEKRCLLVPSSNTKGNHQVKNAIFIASIGAADYVLENDFTIAKFMKIKNNNSIVHTDIVKKNSSQIITKIIAEALNENR